MKLTRMVCLVASMLVAIAAKSQQPASQEPKDRPTRTKVVLLGTGTPVHNPDRSGPATAIVVDDRTYLVDFGPGVVRRAEAGALNKNIPAVQPRNLKVAFVTHLHSDHTAGYSDLILTGWTSGRVVPLEVYGPPGLQSMTEHIFQAYRIDIETHLNPDSPMRDIGRLRDAWKVNAHEIKAGVIYKDEKVTVTAFATKHAMESYGYVLQKTGNIAAVMNSMGHSDVKTAMTYQHPELNAVRDAINSRHILRHTAETVY